MLMLHVTWLRVRLSPIHTAVRCGGAVNELYSKHNSSKVSFSHQSKKCRILPCMHLPSVLYDFSEKSGSVVFSVSFVYVRTCFPNEASGNHSVFFVQIPYSH